MVLNGCSGGQLPRVDIEYLLDLPIQQVPNEEQYKLLKQVKDEQQMIEPSTQIVDTSLLLQESNIYAEAKE